jgi:hypothetical protein
MGKTKDSKKKARLADEGLKITEVDPEEMAFCYGVFQGALRGQLAAPDPSRRGRVFESDAIAEAERSKLPEALREFLAVKEGRLTLTDTPLHRAAFAVLKHYDGHPDQQALFCRIFAFYFFVNKHKIETLSKYTKRCEDEPDVVLVHPAVMQAVAKATMSNSLTFEKNSFLKLIDKLASEAVQELE